MSKKPEAVSSPSMTRVQLSRYERERRTRKIVIYSAIAVGIITLAMIAAAAYQLLVYEPSRTVASVSGVPISVQNLQKRMQFNQASVINNANQLAGQLQQLQGDDQQNAFLRQIYQQQFQQITAQGSAESIAQSAFDQMTDEILIKQEATKRGISASASEVQEQLEKQFGFYRSTLTPFPTNTPAPTDTPIANTAGITQTPTAFPTAEPRLQPTSIAQTDFDFQLSRRIEGLKSFNYTETDLRAFIESDLLRNKVQEAIGKEAPTTAPHFQFDYIRFNVITDAVKAADRLASRSIRFDALISETNAITEPTVIGSGGSVDWTSESSTRNQFGAEVLDQLSYKSIGAPTSIVSATNGSFYILLPKGRETRALEESELKQEQRNRFDDWLSKSRVDSALVKKDIDPLTVIPATVRTRAEQFLQSVGQVR
jgi:TolA-binding protein